MKRFLLFFLIIAVPLTLIACCQYREGTLDAGAGASTVFLFAGLDEAAENTDVLFLLSVDPSSNRMAVMQIPRDTYFRTNDGAGKINAIYAACRSRGESAEQALSVLSNQISKTFSVPLTASVAFTTAALRAAVDAMGGVTVNIPADMEIEGQRYSEGERLLSGKEAESFVRYRESYVMGDLGRVDAQKLFLSAFLKKARTDLQPASMIRLLLSMREDVITDISLSRALSVGIGMHSRLSSLSAVFFTLPGEPLLHREHWYFIANKKGCETLLSQYFPQSGVFDAAHSLYDESELAQSNIYNDPNFSYLVYTEDDLSSIQIQTKKE